MTTEPTQPDPPANPPTPEPTATDRLPDDHPAAKALAKANREAAELRHRLQEIEDRDKSDLVRAKEALEEKEKALSSLPQQVRRQALRFASAASQQGFLDPEDALAFMDDDVDLSDHKAVEQALVELAQRKPHLVRAAKTPRRPRPVAGGDPDTPDDGAKGKERAAQALRQLKR